MKDIYIRIKPRDPLFFRTAKPFDAGEVSWTESSFMPSPSVIWGSIYTMLIREGVLSLPNKSTPKEIFEKVQLKKILLKTVNKKTSVPDNTYYEPVPLDLYLTTDNRIYNLVFQEAESKFLTKKTRGILKSRNDLEETVEQNNWIHFPSEADYYTRSSTLNFRVENNTFFEKKYSTKVGIKRQSKTKLVEDGQLYRLQQTAFNDDTFIVLHLRLAEELDFPNEGVLKLGGEGRVVDFELAKEEENEFELREIDEKRKRIRGYFYSAFGCDTSTHLDLVDCLEAQLAKKEMKLLAICSGRAEGFSGFDLAKNRPKPLVRCFPAGTVIYLEFKEELDCLEWRDKMNSFLEESPLESYRGYNQFVVCEF